MEERVQSDSVGSESTKSKCFKQTTTVAVREASPEVDLAETEDSYGENVLEFDASSLGDLRSFRLFVVSPPMTDDLWKIFYEQHFGVESANTEINRMKQKKVVFKWRLLYEYHNSHEVKIDALMTGNALCNETAYHIKRTMSFKIVPIQVQVREMENQRQENNLLFLVFSGFFMRRKTVH
ncbi:hypothetical protein OPV22_017988 [Ensete ventricosum]|uniref:Protein FAR1-RELATED SEQUENCE n=1 Tax=Ensete ventricosum TaxID=4639 RepID=A0AAV8QYH4_ENSVE|nr:hypothetical protein OPV22_017988 [Ensete ventricosum]